MSISSIKNVFSFHICPFYPLSITKHDFVDDFPYNAFDLSRSADGLNRTAINWILPCACWFKWNCNGSQLENHGNGGILYFVVDFEV